MKDYKAEAEMRADDNLELCKEIDRLKTKLDKVYAILKDRPNECGEYYTLQEIKSVMYARTE